MRGEYFLHIVKHLFDLELPPRARRIRILDEYTIGLHGTTSACAENTLAFLTSLATTWNYLRVRGEYVSGGRGGRQGGNYLRVRGEYAASA